MDCHEFDAQVARPEASLLDLEKKFVRLRITNMADADIGRFDFDFDNTYASFVLNTDGQIYLRYGGRTDASAEAFVSIEGFERALEKALVMHDGWKSGELDLPLAGESRSARVEYPAIDALARGGRCVHCHDVASAKASVMLASSSIDKKRDVWLYPDPWMLGLVLDPQDGNLLKATEVTAAKAGLKAGERIAAVAGLPVSTFTDIQYRLNGLAPEADSVVVELSDGKTVDLPLPEGWNASDIARRQIGKKLSPVAGFGLKPLPRARRVEMGLPEYGLSGYISVPDGGTTSEGLRESDFLLSIDGVRESPLTSNPAVYLALHYEDGDKVDIVYQRSGEDHTTEIVLQKYADPGLRSGRMGRGRGR